jgi:hypothetical protein
MFKNRNVERNFFGVHSAAVKADVIATECADKLYYNTNNRYTANPTTYRLQQAIQL